MFVTFFLRFGLRIGNPWSRRSISAMVSSSSVFTCSSHTAIGGLWTLTTRPNQALKDSRSLLVRLATPKTDNASWPTRTIHCCVTYARNWRTARFSPVLMPPMLVSLKESHAVSIRSAGSRGRANTFEHHRLKVKRCKILECIEKIE